VSSDAVAGEVAASSVVSLLAVFAALAESSGADGLAVSEGDEVVVDGADVVAALLLELPEAVWVCVSVVVAAEVLADAGITVVEGLLLVSPCAGFLLSAPVLITGGVCGWGADAGA
jgi:hypothetical protein